jgi:hypothetical protein
MKLRLAAALLAFAAPSALAAQDIQITLDQTLVENFDGNVVPEALTPFNGTVTQQAGTDGSPVYNVVFPGGMTALAQPMMCKDQAAHTGCTSLRLTAFFGLPEGKTPADMAQVINVFNATHEATQLIYSDEGTSRMVHYVIADFGITKTNLVIQIYNFRSAAQTYAKQLFTKPAEGQAGNS